MNQLRPSAAVGMPMASWHSLIPALDPRSYEISFGSMGNDEESGQVYVLLDKTGATNALFDLLNADHFFVR